MESHKIAVLALEKLSGAGHGGLHDSKEKIESSLRVAKTMWKESNFAC